MKSFIAACFILLLLHADETAKKDDAVADIPTLKADYDACQNELADLKERNRVLKTEMSSLEDLNSRNKEPFAKEIDDLKKELQEYKKQIEQKDQEIKDLNFRIINIETPDNEFPKLMMKDEIEKKDANLTYFEATTYRLKDQTYVYDSADGNKTDIWNKDTIFTSYIKKGDWIKITGYFVSGVWVSSKDKELWVPESSAKKY